MTGRESTHIDTAFMGLTSSDGVTVDCKLPARRDTDQPFFPPRDHDSRQALMRAKMPTRIWSGDLPLRQAGEAVTRRRTASSGIRS